jgi:hypothetical protein
MGYSWYSLRSDSTRKKTLKSAVLDILGLKILTVLLTHILSGLRVSPVSL